MQFARNKWSFIFIFGLLLFNLILPPVYASQNHDELFVFIGDSLMKTKSEDWDAVNQNITQFETDWNSIREKDSKAAIEVDKELSNVQEMLATGKNDPEQIKSALSALSNAVVAYDAEQNPVDKEKEKEKVKQVFPFLAELKGDVEKEDFDAAKRQYQTFLNKWTAAEKIVRNESVVYYGLIEKNMAFIRIAITEEPPSKEKALNSIAELETSINDFLSGKKAKSVENKYSLEDVSNMLVQSIDLVAKSDLKQATDKLNKFLTVWPMVEGDVQTRDSKLYSDIETKVPTAISLLNSQNGDTEKAKSILEDLDSRLKPLLSKTSYSFWDAALILLREGFEGLLIIATLITFLKKTGHAEKQKWIWFGVVSGIIASAILAIVINIVFSQITAASSREYIEGITGIVAVIMMLTVGAWLHNKSNIKNWNQYVNRQMGQAIAKGSLISFAVISFLSIFREGAETIIFYTGMAPYMDISQLLIGILIALVMLAVVGYLFIHYSVKINIRMYFMVATVLIYILSFKILGVSVHALQVSNIVPTHTIHPFPFIDLIGLYPTLETVIPQIILIGIIVALTFWIEKKVDKKTAAM